MRKEENIGGFPNQSTTTTTTISSNTTASAPTMTSSSEVNSFLNSGEKFGSTEKSVPGVAGLRGKLDSAAAATSNAMFFRQPQHQNQFVSNGFTSSILRPSSAPPVDALLSSSAFGFPNGSVSGTGAAGGGRSKPAGNSRWGVEGPGGSTNDNKSEAETAQESLDPQDPRLDPNYAAYYYYYSRFDPRLPPPLYAPGQSWQASSWSMLNSNASAAALTSNTTSTPSFRERSVTDSMTASSRLRQSDHSSSANWDGVFESQNGMEINAIPDSLLNDNSPLKESVGKSLLLENDGDLDSFKEGSLSESLSRMSFNSKDDSGSGFMKPKAKMAALKNSIFSAWQDEDDTLSRSLLGLGGVNRPNSVVNARPSPNAYGDIRRPFSPQPSSLNNAAPGRVFGSEFSLPPATKGLSSFSSAKDPVVSGSGGVGLSRTSTPPPPGFKPPVSNSNSNSNSNSIGSSEALGVTGVTATKVAVTKKVPTSFASIVGGGSSGTATTATAAATTTTSQSGLSNNNSCSSTKNASVTKIPSPFHTSVSSGGSSNSNSNSNSNNNSPRLNALSTGTTVASGLLEEFRVNKSNRKFELSDISGHVVEFSADQHGSRFIQQRLEVCTPEEKEMVFQEILPHSLDLIIDVFGNYVIQKFFEHGTPGQKHQLAEVIQGHVLELSLQMYGCRVVQKALEHILVDQQVMLIRELDGHILKCVKDQNGNHVIQKCIERVPSDMIEFIIASFDNHVYPLATHPYGCRVIQRIFEHCTNDQVKPLLSEIHRYLLNLVQDQYGNYVVQHILERGTDSDRASILDKLAGHMVSFSKHKFASNVVEKCVIYGSPFYQRKILDEILIGRNDANSNIFQMMKDQYANYVVQKMLDVFEQDTRIILIQKITPLLSSLKKYSYGKHIVNKVEKLSSQLGLSI